MPAIRSWSRIRARENVYLKAKNPSEAYVLDEFLGSQCFEPYNECLNTTRSWLFKPKQRQILTLQIFRVKDSRSIRNNLHEIRRGKPTINGKERIVDQVLKVLFIPDF